MNNMHTTNKDMFNAPAEHPPENPYHKRLREFAKGDITKERQQGEYKMMRFRLPLYVYRELKRKADERCVPVGRFTIELLRSWADKQIKAQPDFE